MTYLDSAILVKLYTDEADSEHWRDLLGARTDLATSALALPEVRGAFRRKILLGLLKARAAKRIWTTVRLDTELGLIRTIPLGSDVIDESCRILETIPRRFNLRTLDALHLATARLIDCTALATTDLRMRAAAQALSLRLL